MFHQLKRLTYTGIAASAALLPVAASAQDPEGGPFGLNDFTSTVSTIGTVGLRQFVFRIINIFLGFLGVIAIVLFLYGGFLWMTAAGNEEKVDKARKLIVAAIIGAAIVLGALALTNFVLASLLNATDSPVA